MHFFANLQGKDCLPVKLDLPEHLFMFTHRGELTEMYSSSAQHAILYLWCGFPYCPTQSFFPSQMHALEHMVLAL